MRRPLVTTACFCLAVGLAASAAQACGFHTPDRYAMYPGMTLIRPDMVLLLPILSGALERPFYTLAGYRDLTPTLAFSIQANLLAMLAGVAATIVGIFLISSSPTKPSEGVIYALACIALPAIAAAVKFAWFARVPCDEPSHSRFAWCVLATLVSTGTIALIPFWMSLFGTDTFDYAQRVADLKGFAIIVALLASFVTHVHLFGSFRRPPRSEVARGFDVVPLATPLPAAPVAGVAGQT